MYACVFSVSNTKYQILCSGKLGDDSAEGEYCGRHMEEVDLMNMYMVGTHGHGIWFYECTKFKGHTKRAACSRNRGPPLAEGAPGLPLY